jgi:hypothetical protein
MTDQKDSDCLGSIFKAATTTNSVHWGNLANRDFFYLQKRGVFHDREIASGGSRAAAEGEAGFDSVAKEMEGVRLRAAWQKPWRLPARSINLWLLLRPEADQSGRRRLPIGVLCRCGRLTVSP